MKAWDENENSGGKPMVRRAGYMGHLRSMANSLNDFLPSSVLVQPKNGTTGATGGAAVSQTAATPLTNGECVPDGAQFTPPPPCSIDAADRSNSETQLGELLCAMIPIEVRMRWGNFVQGDLARSNNAAFINYANFPNSSSSSSVSTDDEVSRYKISDEAISAALQNGSSRRHWELAVSPLLVPSIVGCFMHSTLPTVLLSRVNLQAYQHYCSNQSLSASFPDFFGYAEDEFDDSRERLDVVVEQALSGLNFNLSIQEDTTNNALFEQACNELVITEDGDEVGDEAAGLPIVCMESNSPSQLCSSVRPTAEASVSPNVDGDRRRIEETGTSPILCRQPGDHHSLTQGVSAAVEESQVPADGHLKGLSLTYLKEVFCSLTTSNEQQQENLSASTMKENDPDRSYGHLREASRRGDEALPDLASTTVASVTDVSPPRLLLTGRTPNHELQHADRHTPPLLSSPPLSPSPVRDLHPRLALAPGPTPSNGQPIMSVARSRRLSASPTADHPPWVDVVDDLGSPVMRGSLNSVLSANGASAAPLGDPTADSVLPRRYTSQKYTWSASSSVPGPSSFTASMRETQTELQDVVSSELPDANSFVLPRVALLTTDVSSDSSAASSSSSLNPAISVTREKLDSVGSPASVAVYSSTADPVSASAATSAMFVTYDQAPVFSLPAFSIPRPIQPTVRSHRLTRLSLPNGQKAVEAAAAEAALETPNSASPTSYRAAINTPEIVMQILNGTVPDSASIGRRLPASGPAPSVFEDRSRVKRLVGQLTEDEEEEEGRFSPRRSWGGRHTLPPVSNGSMVPLESPQCVLLSRRPPPFVISESELDEEEDDDDEEEEEEDVDGDGYPADPLTSVAFQWLRPTELYFSIHPSRALVRAHTAQLSHLAHQRTPLPLGYRP
ncbi:unnamed protein product [Schistocephalus solidus]|uniref:Protein kinase domain-containing protein n=1 Tax=Schistocephalus solidus TaxID=70667 RepID=A0A183T419_SCHSO|nr:unnamed protein product [Schistocephalus solidus]